LVKTQCTNEDKLQSLADFERKNDKYDYTWILKEIRAITLRFEGIQYIFLSLDDARKSYYGYVQPKEQNLAY